MRLCQFQLQQGKEAQTSLVLYQMTELYNSMLRFLVYFVSAEHEQHTVQCYRQTVWKNSVKSGQS